MNSNMDEVIVALEQRNYKLGGALPNLTRLAMMLATGREPNSFGDSWLLESDKPLGIVSAYTGFLNPMGSQPGAADDYIRKLPQADRYDEYLVEAKQRMTNFFNGVYDDK